MLLPTTQTTQNLKENNQPLKVLEGGTSSGKTYGILHRIADGCMTEWDNETIDVIRDTFPALRISAMKDWEDILKQRNIYNKEMHNKTENVYHIRSNIVRFYSADNEEKMRGPRRDRTYFNEVLEISRMKVMQVLLRTRKETYFDYNPSEQFHWFYDEILERPDVYFHKSTYKDNPFLETRIIQEIENLKNVDLNLWRIYGLGERGVAQSTIYTNWHYALDQEGKEILFEKFEGQRLFGMDFGFNNPTALVRVKYHEKGEIYAEQLMYDSELTSEQIIEKLDKLRKAGKIDYDDLIFADAARPEIIEDIKRAGYNIRRAKKEKGSVLRGINFLKRNSIWVNKASVDMVKEFRSYKWKTDRNERVLDTPIDLNDHLMDALRYAVERLSRTRPEIGAA